MSCYAVENDPILSKCSTWLGILNTTSYMKLKILLLMYYVLVST